MNVIITGFQGTSMPVDDTGKEIILVGTVCAVVKSTVLPSVTEIFFNCLYMCIYIYTHINTYIYRE